VEDPEEELCGNADRDKFLDEREEESFFKMNI